MTNQRNIDIQSAIDLLKEEGYEVKEPIAGCVFNISKINQRLRELEKDRKWLKAKSNGVLRYVSRKVNDKMFVDDGGISGQAPSPYCRYENYEELSEEETIKAWVDYFNRQATPTCPEPIYTQSQLDEARKEEWITGWKACEKSVFNALKNSKT